MNTTKSKTKTMARLEADRNRKARLRQRMSDAGVRQVVLYMHEEQRLLAAQIFSALGWNVSSAIKQCAANGPTSTTLQMVCDTLRRTIKKGSGEKGNGARPSGPNAPASDVPGQTTFL